MSDETRSFVCPCPSPDQLSAFLAGRLPADTLAQVADHLGSCSACLERVEEMGDVSDPLIEQLRRPASPAALSEQESRRAASLVEALASTLPEAGAPTV